MLTVLKLRKQDWNRWLRLKRNDLRFGGQVGKEKVMVHVHAWSKELSELQAGQAPAATQVRTVASDLDVALVAPRRAPQQTQVQAVSSEWAQVRASTPTVGAPPVLVKSLSEDVAQAFTPAR